MYSSIFHAYQVHFVGPILLPQFFLTCNVVLHLHEDRLAVSDTNQCSELRSHDAIEKPKLTSEDFSQDIQSRLSSLSFMWSKQVS
jgi:hypothetical protein